jgi:DNA-directed RNA polymerase specialized sigma subunit
MRNRAEKDIKTLLKEWWHCLGIIGGLEEIGGLEAVAQPLREQDAHTMAALEPLDDLEKTILLHRYRDRRKWREVADLVGYSEKHTIRLHRQALAKLESTAQGGRFGRK